MGDQLMRRAGAYWVLFYQLLPEAGERVAIALIFESEGRARVEYDAAFTKVRKLYPRVDPKLLAFYLDSIQSDLGDHADVKSVLDRYGPQLSPSEPRQVALPISASNVRMLMERYIYPQGSARRRRKRRNGVADEIEAFVRRIAGDGAGRRTHVRAREILGVSVPGTKPVAIAMETPAGWTLIDGVDLNQLTAKEAVDRVDDVSRTFWNYARAISEMDLPTRIKRVGIVLNGSSQRTPGTHEAHEYALHRFEAESDYSIDAASAEADQRLLEALAASG